MRLAAMAVEFVCLITRLLSLLVMIVHKVLPIMMSILNLCDDNGYGVIDAQRI